MKPEPAEFWDKKILQWEKDKYSPTSRLFVLFDVNSSVKSRMKLARSILKKMAPGRSVAELGCGSGLLAEEIIAYGATKYVGIDISAVAIEAAKQRVVDSQGNIEFVNANISEITAFKTDICFSLGLFDWLTPSEIKVIQQKVDTRFFFHAFSEKRFSPSQFLHKLYVFLMYGRNSSGYVPKYHRAETILQSLVSTNISGAKFFRRPELSFGCVAYWLPEEPEDLK